MRIREACLREPNQFAAIIDQAESDQPAATAESRR